MSIAQFIKDATAAGLWAARSQSKQKTLGGSPRVVLLGDSNMMNAKGAFNPSAISYDSASGVITVTANGHGLYTDTPVFFAYKNTPGWCFYDLALTRVDANTFTLPLPAGLGAAPATIGDVWIGNAQQASGDYPYCWLNARRPRIVRVVACVGDNTAAILAKVSHAVAASPTVVEWRAGTNDINVRTPDAVYADALSIARQLSGAGFTQIMHTIPPVGDADATKGAWVAAYNKRLRTISNQITGVTLCDDWAALVDSASVYGAALSGMLRADNLHFTAKGGRSLAIHPLGLQAAYDKITQTTSRHPVSQIEAYDATNNPSGDDAFGNGLLHTATGGTITAGVSGTAASKLQINCTGMGAAVVASVVAAAVGSAQRVVGTPAASGDQMLIKTADAAMSGRCTAGEYRRGVCHIKTSGIAANGAVKSVCLIMQITTGGVVYSQIRSLYSAQSASTAFLQSDIDMDVETDPFIIPTAGITAILMQVQMDFGGAGAGTAVTLDVSQWGLQKVLEP